MFKLNKTNWHCLLLTRLLSCLCYAIDLHRYRCHSVAFGNPRRSLGSPTDDMDFVPSTPFFGQWEGSFPSSDHCAEWTPPHSSLCCRKLSFPLLATRGRRDPRKVPGREQGMHRYGNIGGNTWRNYWTRWRSCWILHRPLHRRLFQAHGCSGLRGLLNSNNRHQHNIYLYTITANKILLKDSTPLSKLVGFEQLQADCKIHVCLPAKFQVERICTLRHISI